MCSHYQVILDRERYFRAFGVEPPVQPHVEDVWPGSRGVLIRRPPEADSGDEAVPARQALAGVFGLLPHWAKDEKFARHTYNARSETVHEKPSFRDAWQRAQRCIVPASAIFEPDWRSGRAVATRIERADRAALGLAGLWSRWRSPKGETVFSYTLLTINAAEHSLMRHLHKPGDEKRMVVLLEAGDYDGWLQAPVAEARDFLRPWPDGLMTAVPATKPQAS